MTNTLRDQARRRFEVAPRADLEEEIKLCQQDQKLAKETLEKGEDHSWYQDPQPIYCSISGSQRIHCSRGIEP